MAGSACWRGSRRTASLRKARKQKAALGRPFISSYVPRRQVHLDAEAELQGESRLLRRRAHDALSASLLLAGGEINFFALGRSGGRRLGRIFRRQDAAGIEAGRERQRNFRPAVHFEHAATAVGDLAET